MRCLYNRSRQACVQCTPLNYVWCSCHFRVHCLERELLLHPFSRLFVHVAAQAACPACMPAAQPAMDCELLQGVVDQRQPLCAPRRCSERQQSRHQGRLSKGALSLTARLAIALSACPAITRTGACNMCISSACLSLKRPWLKAAGTHVCAAGKGVAPGRAPGPRSQCQLCAAALCVPGGGLP